jgi:hypothetical protein
MVTMETDPVIIETALVTIKNRHKYNTGPVTIETDPVTIEANSNTIKTALVTMETDPVIILAALVTIKATWFNPATGHEVFPWYQTAWEPRPLANKYKYRLTRSSYWPPWSPLRPWEPRP